MEKLPKNIKREINNITAYLISSNDGKITSIIFDLENNSDHYHYRSLVIYTYNGLFLPIIIQSEKLKDGFSKISFNSIDKEEYMSFYVNKESKVGKFNMSRDIPFDSIINSKNQSSKIASFSSLITCGPNQYFSTCGPTSPSTIYNYEQLIPQTGCVEGCFCNNGYALDANGICRSLSNIVNNPIPKSACVRKTNSFSECMNCTIKECSEDWVCYLGCGVQFVYCMALFSAVCAFA